LIKSSFINFNESDKEAKFVGNKDEDFNKIIIEDENNFDFKLPYPESINNGFNFTVKNYLKKIYLFPVKRKGLQY
jgi:hypothetical protein